MFFCVLVDAARLIHACFCLSGTKVQSFDARAIARIDGGPSCLSGVRKMTTTIQRILFIPVFLLIVACSTNPTVANGGDPQMVAQAQAALQQLYASTPEAQALKSRAKAVVVFPDITKAGLIVGAEGGKGVMFGPDGKVIAYYRARAVSYGLQAGAQSFSEALFLMTDSAITELTSGAGLSVGSGPSVVVVDAGMAKSLTTTTLKSDVYAFLFGQQGLMAGVGLQGQRIVRFDAP
jgi:lipid-binding SYLF domain-containing protein